MNSTEQIKSRMINKAASLWGVPANEIEVSFDPVVALLISACAFEIEKLSREISDSQTRITEKLIQLMTPEMVYGPRPAHTIMYAEPIEARNVVRPEHLFYYKKKLPFKKSRVKYKNIYFSAVKDFVLVDSLVQYVATGDQLHQIGEKRQIESLVMDNKGSDLPNSTLYLGINTEGKKLDLKDISFYFELQKAEEKELFYHHLKNTQWEQESGEIEFVEGFYKYDNQRKLDLDVMFEDVSSKSRNIVQQTCNLYIDHFLTVKASKKKALLKKSQFSELETFMEVNGVKTESDVRWIKITFPRIISNDSLGKVFCSINAFPVVNRSLEEMTYQLRDFVNIVPINTEDFFLDMAAVSNTEGKKYQARDSQMLEGEKGTFMLRNDNIGKLDNRNAREYLLHLIELLKDESASFSLYNNDFLQSNLKGLNQKIALLEKKVNEIAEKPTETNYVMIKPFKKKEKLILEYWITNGDLANGIKSGSEVEIYRGAGVKQKTSYLFGTTSGGRDDLTQKERYNAYRRSLLSRNRIVTKEDVKALCYEMYGEKIERAEVRKGYVTDVSRYGGMVACIEIVLYPSKAMVSEHEWDAVNSNLMLFLEKNSTNVFPYEIIIKN